MWSKSRLWSKFKKSFYPKNWKIALVLFLECEICYWSADDVFEIYKPSYQGSLFRPLQTTTSFGHTDSYSMKSLSLIIFVPPCHWDKLIPISLKRYPLWFSDHHVIQTYWFLLNKKVSLITIFTVKTANFRAIRCIFRVLLRN